MKSILEPQKKILIIAYFFPPCNLTASNRPYSWAKNFALFGYNATVITRNWELGIKEQKDLHRKAGSQTEYLDNGEFKQIVVPFEPNLRDKLYTTDNQSKWVQLGRKFLTMSELILQNWFWYFTPYKNLYYAAYKELKLHKYDAILVTGNPFITFKFGYKLSKIFQIPWFADYRDDWTCSPISHQWYGKNKLLTKIGLPIEKRSELKWTSNISCFFSVSPEYVDKISKHINKKGNIIYNGFIDNDFDLFKTVEPYQDFTITFNGSLYSLHNIELVAKGFMVLSQKYKHLGKLRMLFIGTDFDGERERLKKAFAGIFEQVEITKRVPRNTCIEMQYKSQVMLLMAYGEVKGAPSTKLFDYLALKKNILLFPSDNDIMEQITTETNQAIVCNTLEQMIEKLSPLIEKFYAKETIEPIINRENQLKYTRENQLKILSQKIDEYLEVKQ
jgi:hypothetical protein